MKSSDQFVKKPQDDFFCPICLELLLHPILFKCGHQVCYTCSSQLLKDECPTCRESNVLSSGLLNKLFQRQIMSVKVYCHNRYRGCEWKGELSYLQNHLSPDKKECKVSCSFGCGSSVCVYEMKHHKMQECVKRPTTCEYCNSYHNTHDIVTEKHHPVCLRSPKGQIINQEVAITSDTESQYLCNLSPVVFTITDFMEKKQADKEWTSPPFYTCTQGYKFCLKVYPNGNGSGKGSHMSVSAHLMRGEYDDKLEWPFQGCIVFKLLNWRPGDKNHFARSLDLNTDTDPAGTRTSRVTDSETAAEGYRYSWFISHKKLDYNATTNTEYLQDDYLKMEILVVNQYSTDLLHKTPSWQYPLITTQSACEFTLTEFSIRKHSNNRYFSPPFYTHQRGYKMYLEVYANGQGSGEGTHVTIFATLTKGEYDQELQWPFAGDIIIEALNWREDKEHHKKTMSINKFSTKRKKSGEKYKLFKFISHSSIGTKYLQDDCLRLRVGVACMYSTNHLNKIPSWQNSLTQSLCEFTLTDVHKRKKFNNRYYSKGFYINQSLGYKLCLEVCANGKRSGKGTHISVFVYLMKGKYDDILHFPFEGTIIVELLNWKEDKGHHEKSISFNPHADPDGTICGRVKEGKYTTNSWGRSEFISHLSLFSPTNNTKYLNDNDCLRLRVKEVIFFSTKHLHKIPSWQDPLTITQSDRPILPKQFTLTDISKRMQFNNEYASPPFYTHPGGYKMILFVIANGDQTHITIKPRLMKGEHDDDLHWPFVGDVTVELLNWRENKKHQTMIVKFNSDTDPDSTCTARVTQRHLAEKVLYDHYCHDQFISLSSLSYNPITNTEYLEEDCLRLRVSKVSFTDVSWQDSFTATQSLCEFTCTNTGNFTIMTISCVSCMGSTQ